MVLNLPENVRELVLKGVKELRPVQIKALEKGIFNEKNIIVASPTASGKTLIAELLVIDSLLNKRKKAIYVVPLKALASEKYKEFKDKYGDKFKVRISVGDSTNDFFNMMFDILVATSEKLDSLIRHNREFLNDVGVVVIDEIHLLNDESRGPTLEILLTIFKTYYKKIKIVGLSATISNASEISGWLNAELIEDNWRPVELSHCILKGDELLRFR